MSNRWDTESDFTFEKVIDEVLQEKKGGVKKNDPVIRNFPAYTSRGATANVGMPLIPPSVKAETGEMKEINALFEQRSEIKPPPEPQSKKSKQRSKKENRSRQKTQQPVKKTEPPIEEPVPFKNPENLQEANTSKLPKLDNIEKSSAVAVADRQPEEKKSEDRKPSSVKATKIIEMQPPEEDDPPDTLTEGESTEDVNAEVTGAKKSSSSMRSNILEMPQGAKAVKKPLKKNRPGEYDFINTVYSDANVAVKRLDKKLRGISAKILLLFPLTLLSVYMTVGVTFGLPMPFGFTYLSRPFMYVLSLCFVQIMAMLIASDVMAPGLKGLIMLRPTLDSLVLFSSLCIFIHSVSLLRHPENGFYLPFTCVSVALCFFSMYAKRQRTEELRRRYRVFVVNATPTAVKICDEKARKIAVRTEKDAYVDLKEIAFPDSTEQVSLYYAPIIIISTIILALLASYGAGRRELFFWCLSALASVVSPVSLLFSSSLPENKVARHLHSSGSVFINEKRTRLLAACDGVILTDNDVQPTGSVELLGMRVARQRNMDEVVSYTTAVLKEVGGGLSRAFTEYAKSRATFESEVENIRFYDFGGMSGTISSKHILVGTLSFMTRMGVEIHPEEIKDIKGTPIFVSINSFFSGVFMVKYSHTYQPERGFEMLLQNRVDCIMATKDFNQSREDIEKRFYLHNESLEFEELYQRLYYYNLEPEEKALPLAILGRSGMLQLAEVVVYAKNLKKAIKFNQFSGFVCAGLGILMMYFLSYNFKPSSATPVNVLAYLILWFLVTVISNRLSLRK